MLILIFEEQSPISLYRILLYEIDFCPLTFRRRLLLFFIMWNECTYNFLRASNGVNDYECSLTCFFRMNGMLRIEFCYVCLNGMFRCLTLVVFYLITILRFSTFLKENFFLIRSFPKLLF